METIPTEPAGKQCLHHRCRGCRHRFHHFIIVVAVIVTAFIIIIVVIIEVVVIVIVFIIVVTVVVMDFIIIIRVQVQKETEDGMEDGVCGEVFYLSIVMINIR